MGYETHDSMNEQQKVKKQRTYNSRDSLVVTDPTTNRPLRRFTRGDLTGPRAAFWVWSYVGDGEADMC